MSKEIVLSSSARLALLIVEETLSLALKTKIVLKDCSILLHDPWAHKFKDGAQIREAVITGHLRLPVPEEEVLHRVEGVVSVFSYADGRPARIPPGHRMTIELKDSRGLVVLLYYAVWPEPGSLVVGEVSGQGPIPWDLHF